MRKTFKISWFFCRRSCWPMGRHDDAISPLDDDKLIISFWVKKPRKNYSLGLARRQGRSLGYLMHPVAMATVRMPFFFLLLPSPERRFNSLGGLDGRSWVNVQEEKKLMFCRRKEENRNEIDQSPNRPICRLWMLSGDAADTWNMNVHQSPRPNVAAIWLLPSTSTAPIRRRITAPSFTLIKLHFF